MSSVCFRPAKGKSCATSVMQVIIRASELAAFILKCSFAVANMCCEDGLRAIIAEQVSF